MAFTIRTDSAGLNRKLRSRIAPYPRAVAAGINRTARAAETIAVREIQRDVGASVQKTIRKNLSVRGATAGKPQALLIARSTKEDRIPIYEMRPKPKSISKRRPSGGVRYGARNKLLVGSFIAKLVSGHVGVFKRRDKARLPIDELHGPSVALVFSRKRIQATMTAFINERLPKEISQALKHFTRAA